MSAHTIDEILTVTTAELLRAGGVDNWEWYGDSLEDYVRSDDELEDAESFLSSLASGGVDNWDWYGASLEGLDEYEEYLNSLSDVATADSFYAWKNAAETAAAAIVVVPEPAVVVVEKRLVKGDTEKKLHEYISAKYGEARADEIFEKAIEAGFWKYSNFQKEYAKAVKVIVEGLENPLEHARAALFAAVVKNKKIDGFLDTVATS